MHDNFPDISDLFHVHVVRTDILLLNSYNHSFATRSDEQISSLNCIRGWSNVAFQNSYLEIAEMFHVLGTI